MDLNDIQEPGVYEAKYPEPFKIPEPTHYIWMMRSDRQDICVRESIETGETETWTKNRPDGEWVKLKEA